jgi:hypothetical protein
MLGGRKGVRNDTFISVGPFSSAEKVLVSEAS